MAQPASQDIDPEIIDNASNIKGRMHRFWNTVIEPVLMILQPESIIEIGSDDGKNTANLLEFCKQNDAILHAIDPLPKFDVAVWQERYGRYFVFHRSLSLNALAQIDQFDVVLIDGDHNWYTVFNELKLIERRCIVLSQPFPLVILHDIGWPYGRRDLYYNPENIPEAFRKPYKRRGIRPDSGELLEEGGLNAHLYNSIYENNLQNGVLTAVEDFLKETEQTIELLELPGLSGLAILIPSKLKDQNRELAGFLGKFDMGDVLKQYFEMIEGARLETELLLSEENEALKKIKSSHKEEIESFYDQKESEIARYKKAIEGENEALKKIKSSHKKEIEDKESEIAKLQVELRKLIGFINSLKDLCSAILNSRRWKLGSAIGDMVQKLMFRPDVPAPADRLNKIAEGFLKWRKISNMSQPKAQKKNT
jgi:hypothetical protein